MGAGGSKDALCKDLMRIEMENAMADSSPEARKEAQRWFDQLKKFKTSYGEPYITRNDLKAAINATLPPDDTAKYPDSRSTFEKMRDGDRAGYIGATSQSLPTDGESWIITPAGMIRDVKAMLNVARVEEGHGVHEHGILFLLAKTAKHSGRSPLSREGGWDPSAYPRFEMRRGLSTLKDFLLLWHAAATLKEESKQEDVFEDQVRRAFLNEFEDQEFYEDDDPPHGLIRVRGDDGEPITQYQECCRMLGVVNGRSDFTATTTLTWDANGRLLA